MNWKTISNKYISYHEITRFNSETLSNLQQHIQKLQKYNKHLLLLLLRQKDTKPTLAVTLPSNTPVYSLISEIQKSYNEDVYRSFLFFNDTPIPLNLSVGTLSVTGMN
eukprot:snap_masked-scaffold_1-processed-gene-12.12-mRNA-1 protein AED:1.00 eAED:1.00 QI:0/0/0/0/1/1/3/0/107